VEFVIVFCKDVCNRQDQVIQCVAQMVLLINRASRRCVVEPRTSIHPRKSLGEVPW
jgi:hypothetical protein